MVSVRRSSLFRSVGKKLIAVALFLAGAMVLADLSLSPIIESVTTYECHAALDQLINRSVSDELKQEETEYGKLVELVTGDNGEIISVESNSVNINLLKAGISERMNRELRDFAALEIMIPIGTLTGIQMLHGKGFNVGMTVTPIGYADTRLKSEFTSAGLNQTHHRILVEITVKADAIVLGYSTDVTITTTVVAAETIIVGKVPDAYTHVTSYDDDLMGTLQDYGAQL